MIGESEGFLVTCATAGRAGSPLCEPNATSWVCFCRPVSVLPPLAHSGRFLHLLSLFSSVLSALSLSLSLSLFCFFSVPLYSILYFSFSLSLSPLSCLYLDPDLFPLIPSFAVDVSSSSTLLSLFLFLFLSIYPSFYPFICQFICLSTSLSPSPSPSLKIITFCTQLLKKSGSLLPKSVSASN